jgi:putative endonuclease
MEYFAYIIRSAGTKRYYTGITSDINRRLKQHNQKLCNTQSTRNLTDFELVFCQVVESRIEARKLEKFLKSGYGREFRDEVVKYTILGL